ncbi:MAG: DUF2946 family protein [Hyphomicrobiaceae bacterium]
MLWRRWIGMLAVLGVLLHAGALVRHNATMLGATAQANALLADLAVICHGTGTQDLAKTASLPDAPPADPQSSCPLCSGLTPAFALASPLPTPIPTLRVADPAVFQAPGHRVTAGVRTSPPPARGPPALA